MADKLSEAQLEAIIAQQIELARSADDKTDNGNTRSKQLDYFFGKMDAYVPPEVNRSKVVSRDVADTINWLMPEIIDIFTASRRMFLADPEEPEDLDYADEVTDGLNHIFWKQNFGYGIVYDGTFDALLHGDGIVKTYWDDEAVYGPAKFHDGLSEDQLAMLAGDDSTEVLAKTENTVQLPHPDDPAQMVDTTSYDVKLRHKKADGRLCVEVIPRDEFLMDADATSLEDAAFKDHWQRKTRSALLQMGYDKDQVWVIPEAVRNETSEQQARRLNITTEATDKSMELVDYHECFIMVDVDGDGVAEMVRACYGGPGGAAKGALLDWEVWEDEDPFDNIPCEPIPHRFGSRSMADETIDIQDVKTVLWRQLLNNTYWVNNPQNVVSGKVKNPEALTDGQFGQPVFAEAGTTIAPLVREYIGDKALAGLNYADEVKAARTGVNAQSMALDPETLQNQSATANQNAVNASHLQPQLIARNMAEYGWSKVARKMLRVTNKHETKPRTILVSGKPIQIDPRNWNPDMHVSVNTGLGTGSRDKDAMMLGQVLQQQLLYIDRISIPFPEKALEMLKYVHNTVTKFAESGGLKNSELFWPDINDQDIEQGKQILAERAKQPPPEVMLEQMKQQGAQALADKNGEVTMQVEAGKAQVAAHQAELQAQGDVVKNQAELQADLQTKAADRENAVLLAQQQHAYDLQKLDAELTFKKWEIEQKYAIEREKMQHAATVADANNAARAEMAKNKPAGPTN